jgi:hypothetical protein
MYLVSPDYLNGKAKQPPPPPPPPPPLVSKEAKMPGIPPPLTKKKKSTNEKSNFKRIIKKKKKRSSDDWVRLRAKLQEADLERKREIKTIADFLKKYYPHQLLNRRYCQKSDRFIRVRRPFGVLFPKRHPRRYPHRFNG